MRNHASWGYDVRLVARDEFRLLEPNLKEPPEVAAFAASEGALDPVAASNTLVQAARDAGASVHLTTEVVALRASGGRVAGVVTTQGPVEGDLVVMAAGLETPALCQALGVAVPIDSSPAILLRFTAPRRLVNRIVASPEMEMRHGSDGRLLAAEDYIDDSPENGPDAVAERALAIIRQSLDGGDSIELERAEVGWRPMPRDGLPIVGFAPEIEGLYLAVMHAGITLAPAIGRLACSEILDRVSVSFLQTCRPARFMPSAQNTRASV